MSALLWLHDLLSQWTITLPFPLVYIPVTEKAVLEVSCHSSKYFSSAVSCHLFVHHSVHLLYIGVGGESFVGMCCFYNIKMKVVFKYVSQKTFCQDKNVEAFCTFIWWLQILGAFVLCYRDCTVLAYQEFSPLIFVLRIHPRLLQVIRRKSFWH